MLARYFMVFRQAEGGLLKSAHFTFYYFLDMVLLHL